MNLRETTVFIYLHGESQAVPAGVFSHDGTSNTSIFSYGRRYLQHPNALAVPRFKQTGQR